MADPVFATADSLVRGAHTLASAPRVFRLVNDAVNDPHSTVEDIADVISGDASITVRLLRMVNSAYHGLPRKIVSVREAVTALGTLQIRDLVLATNVTDAFEGVPRELINMEEFWKHSLACGLIARSLAKVARAEEPESFFLGGMLHDAGRLLMLLRLPETMAELIARAKREELPLHPLERERFGFDHAGVGEALLNAWGLPPTLAEAAGSHHAPQRAVKNPVLSCVVHASDVVAHALQLGESGTAAVPALQAFAWGRYGMAAHVLRPVVVEVDRHYESMLQALDLGRTGRGK